MALQKQAAAHHHHTVLSHDKKIENAMETKTNVLHQAKEEAGMKQAEVSKRHERWKKQHKAKDSNGNSDNEDNNDKLPAEFSQNACDKTTKLTSSNQFLRASNQCNMEVALVGRVFRWPLSWLGRFLMPKSAPQNAVLSNVAVPPSFSKTQLWSFAAALLIKLAHSRSFTSKFLLNVLNFVVSKPNAILTWMQS